MQDASEEEEKLLFSQTLTKAVPTTNSKWMEALPSSFELAISIQESLRHELLRFIPISRVMVDAIQVLNDDSPSWNYPVPHLEVSQGAMRNSCVCQTGFPVAFLYHSMSVRQ